ncbi:DUF3078 domain-containing protein [Parabacteroides sp. OttesenSCG-928-G06]|nr:DUF3078 domain-containing protein [Parabacteroides sp. OttesenSCG-928-K15]MDL2282014.1 DUF3078 domain-containing protein [Parabacteroides sp. OttesenSCG-928-G06]
MQAQELIVPQLVPTAQAVKDSVRDTQSIPRFTEEDLNDIMDLRSQYERLNANYSKPYQTPEALLRFLNKDKPGISPRARAILDQVFDPARYVPEHMTFKDTIIDSPLLLPLVYKGCIIPVDSLAHKAKIHLDKDVYERMMPETKSFFPEYAWRKKQKEQLYTYLAQNHMEFFKYTIWDFPEDKLVQAPIVKEITELYSKEKLIEPQKEVIPTEPDTIYRFIPNRLYWTSAFQSSIHFTEVYISPNWHQGGVGNLTVNTINTINYDYKRDKVSLTNLFELKLSVNNAPNDTLRNYKFGDNSLRLRSNLGYKAFGKWDYSATAEFTTLMFNNYLENQDRLLAAFASPMSFSFSIGMKYGLDKKFTDKHKKLKLTLNLDPLSYGVWYSLKDKNIDLGRYGFPQIPDPENPDKKIFDNSYQKFGSNIESVLDFTMARNIRLYSRFKYNTTYERVIVESENRLEMGINRYLSTNIHLYVRYDDGVKRGVANEEDNWLDKAFRTSYFQVKQLLSFGLTYKW